MTLESLPTSPRRIARLKQDERGYPVPWFLAWFADGREVAAGSPGAVPDFRVLRRGVREFAWGQGLCWICGEPMGVHRIYVIGPMCVVNRTTMEPPNHRECAEYAVKACPFLVRPRMRRLPHDDIPDRQVDGVMIERNPGVTCLYETASARRFADGRGGWLIRLGEPHAVDWWREGRRATRVEVEDAITSGLPSLTEVADAEGAEARKELDRLHQHALRFLPEAARLSEGPPL